MSSHITHSIPEAYEGGVQMIANSSIRVNRHVASA